MLFIQGLGFLVFSILLFTILPFNILSKSKIEINFWEKLFFGTIVGYVFVTLIFYLLTLVKLPFLILIIPFVSIFVLLKNRGKVPSLELNMKSSLIFLVFLFGMLGQLLVISPSGRLVNSDLLFWSSHAHDASWHIALMNELEKGFPLYNPSFADEKLVNYHFFSDFAPVIFSKYLHLNSLDLYFRFFPFLFSLLIGASSFLLVKKMTKSFTAGIMSSFFIYFVGSFGYIVTLLQGRGIGGESLFWATQIQSSIGNPPQIISDIIVLAFLFFLYLYLENRKKLLFLICAVLVSSLAVFKIYAAVVLLGAVLVSGVWYFIKDKRIDLILLGIVSSALALSLYLPFSKGSTGFLIFEPWWYIRTMIVTDSKLNWIDLELKRQYYASLGTWKSWLRITEYELIGFVIFFVGNLGTRILGMVELVKSFKLFFTNIFSQLLILIALISLVLPLLFLQKGVASNTSQFLQYFLLIFGIFAAISSARMIDRIRNRYLKTLFIVFLVFASVPTQLGLLYQFYSRPAFAKVSSEELSALKFLKDNTPQNSVIVSPPYNQYLDLKESTPDIWDWFDTSYISAFSKRSSFLSDTEQIDIMGYDFKNRLEIENNIFNNPKTTDIEKLLTDNHIDYVYYPKKYGAINKSFQKSLENVYENGEVEIWKVN